MRLSQFQNLAFSMIPLMVKVQCSVSSTYTISNWKFRYSLRNKTCLCLFLDSAKSIQTRLLFQVQLSNQPAETRYRFWPYCAGVQHKSSWLTLTGSCMYLWNLPFVFIHSPTDCKINYHQFISLLISHYIHETYFKSVVSWVTFPASCKVFLNRLELNGALN